LAKFIQEQMAQTAQTPQYLCSTNSILLTKTLNKCPYRSLSYFTEKQEDAEVFYGRRKLTQDLVKRVRDKERLIAVFGASGSGKSSLIRAGLLYQLKSGQEIAGSNNWVYFDPFTPTDKPLVRLREVLGIRPPSPPTLGGIGVQSPPAPLTPQFWGELADASLLDRGDLGGEGFSDSGGEFGFSPPFARGN
jgi:hypothetical protein